MSKFYMTDPDDPEAPVELDSYYGLRPGMKVRYRNPVAPQIPLDADNALVISELIEMRNPHVTTRQVQAVLNDGEWEVNADNLVEDVT